MDDHELLSRAEEALTEIKVNQGLSERHAAVLAALRIRLKGSDLSSLDALLEAADDEQPDGSGLDDAVAEAERTRGGKPTLDDLLSKEPAPKPDWPG